MPNLMKISRQMKKLSIQALDSYRGPLSTVPTNEQRLGEKGTCAKFLVWYIQYFLWSLMFPPGYYKKPSETLFFKSSETLFV